MIWIETIFILIFFILMSTLFWILDPITSKLLITEKMAKLFNKLLIKHRLKKANSQFPQALHLLTSSLAAGQNLDMGIDFMIDESPEPLRSILRSRLKIRHDRLSFNEKMNLLFDDGQHAFLKASLNISKNNGSKSIQVIRKYAKFIQQGEELGLKVKTLTAQVKLSAWVVCLSPFVFLLGMQVISPEIMNNFLNSSMGLILLGINILLNSFGLWLVMRMARLDV